VYDVGEQVLGGQPTASVVVDFNPRESEIAVSGRRRHSDGDNRLLHARCAIDVLD
jgi:hypothetical protein